METPERLKRLQASACINCTLRNGNRIVEFWEALDSRVLIVPCGMETNASADNRYGGIGINCTLRNGNTFQDVQITDTGKVLIVPCGMETDTPYRRTFWIEVLIVPCGMETY